MARQKYSVPLLYEERIGKMVDVGNNMGMIFMRVLVIVIAFAGGIYFKIQDRKEAQEHNADSKQD